MKQPPQYPRPVPTLDLDDCPVLPGTVVYTNDEELDENARASKRRRIEANANAYLRGEGLFILSAGLRGPFDAGWKNPWAAKTKKRKRVIDVDNLPSKRTHLTTSGKQQGRDLTASTTSNSIPRSVVQQDNPFEKQIRSSKTFAHNAKVESWLHRTTDPPRKSFAVPTSPSPKKRSSIAETNQSSKPMWTPTKQRITVNSQDVKAPLYQLPSKVADSFDTIVPPLSRPIQTHDELQSVLHAYGNPPRRRRSDDHGSRYRTRQMNDSLEQPTRAEDAIVSLKRRSEEPVQRRSSGESLKQIAVQELKQKMAGNKATGMRLGVTPVPVPHEWVSSVTETHAPAEKSKKEMKRPYTSRKQADTPEVKLKELDGLINERLQENQQNDGDDTPRVIDPAATNGTSVPYYSTAVSEVRSTKLPPSAQYKPELLASISNMSSGALLPDIPAVPKKTPTNTRTPTESQEKMDMKAMLSLSSNQQQILADDGVKSTANLTKEERVNQRRSSFHQNGPRPTPQQVKMQQKSIKSPVREANGNVRMSQTSLDGSFVKSQTSTQRDRSGKKAKKASFAAEPSFNSSHGSIRSVLKVQKSNTNEKVQKFSPPSPSFSKLMGMDTSAKEGERLKDAPSRRSSQNESSVEAWKAPRSILKTKSTHSSAAATLASAMLSPRDRERSSFSKTSYPEMQPSSQNRMSQRQREESFDIEEALDDLGSFLSTWDAEKEGVRAM